MASAPAPEMGSQAKALLSLAREVSSLGGAIAASAAGKASMAALKADCVGLSRKVSLLSNILEEIRDFTARGGGASSPPPSAAAAASSSSAAVSPASCLADMLLALEAAKRSLLLGRQTLNNVSSAFAIKNLDVQFQYVTWQLEKVLGNLPYEYFDISVEVQEEVELVRAQLRRATNKSGIPDVNFFSAIYNTLSRTYAKETREQSSSRSEALQIDNISHDDHDFWEIVMLVAEVNKKFKCDAGKITSNVLERLKSKVSDLHKSVRDDESGNLVKRTLEEAKNPDPLVIPEDFRCPISLELMKDPVIVSTGQTYERSFIQKWIDYGNQTCPKTQQKLQNLTLTPNHVLRSLIMQWCEAHRVEQPCRTTSRQIRKSDGSFHEMSSDRSAIDALVRNLSNISLEEQRSAAAEIRSLAKRSTESRILIAEAGAIPALVHLLSANDPKTQEHAVTAILNLSIYDHNKELIMLAGASIPIIQLLRFGSMEARENAAAAIFSLSHIDENKITIGSTQGAIEELVELLQSGSSRGKKDAAAALFNLCIYHGNKARAVRAGILTPLLQMLQDTSSSGMIDEALTILSVLVSHQEGKVATAKAHTIPLLIDILRTGQPRNKENAAAILLALCKTDGENLACIGRLGALIPLTEVAKTGTERAKRKATSLLEHLGKLQVL